MSETLRGASRSGPSATPGRRRSGKPGTARFGASPRSGGLVEPSWADDEWWRERNPGASVARGLMWALAVSAVLWGLLALAVYLVLAA